jgi:RHS repeat-associated protein
LLATLFGVLLPAASFAATKTIWVPEPGVSTEAVVAYSISYNLAGCAPVSPTTATITVAPAHGTTTIVSQSFTNACDPGVSFPGVQVNYTWTDTSGSPGSGGDAFHVHFASAEGTVDYDIFVAEGFPGDDLGKEPPPPCTGCQASAGAPSVPPSPPTTGEDLSAFASPISTDGRMATGAPIDVGSGNVFYEHADYVTAGANALAFTRYYNSGGSINSFAVDLVGTNAVNHNWRSNYDRYIDILNPSVVAAERPDGKVLSFYLVGSAWTPDTDVDYTLTHSGATWTLTGPDDTVETYTTAAIAAGGVVATSATLNSIKARNGYTQTLNYTGSQLTSVTDSYSRKLSFAYNGDGTMTSVTTPDSTTITYGYAAAPLVGAVAPGQQLTTVTFPTTPPQTITYNYANSGLPFALTSVTDEDGNTYDTWTYDASGRGLTSAQGGSLNANLVTVAYPALGTTTTVTNALGVTDTYTFTRGPLGVSAPQVTQISRAATGTTAAATETITYDANGYVASLTDWNGNQASYTNNAHGLPTSLTEAVGTSVARTVTIAYDPTFVHLPDTIASAGVTRSYTYDSTGNPLTIKLTDTTATTAPYATGGQTRTWTNTWSNFLLASTKSPNGNTTSFAYSASGALSSVTDALSHVTSITAHTGGGLPEVIVDPNNVTTTLTYEPRQRLVASAVTTGAGVLTTSFAYDPAGNLTQTTLPDGSFIARAYDAAHRLTKRTDALGNYTAYTLDALGDRTAVKVFDSGNTLHRQHSGTFDALGRVLVDTAGAGQTTTLTYDKNGNALTVTDGLSHTTTRTFDALNRLATSADANGGVTTITYDPHNRITAVKDANGNTTSYVFDGLGEAIGQTSPDTGATVYRFDSDGNLTQKVDAAAVTVNMTYDALDRLLTRAFPADATQNAAYTYDVSSDASGFPIGRLATRSDATGLTAFDYDERGNVLSAKSSGAPGGANLSTAYAYDKASRVSAVTYPSGLTISYERDAQGNVSAVATTPPGAEASDAGAATTMATLKTLPFGPDYAATLGNGVTESRAYDLDYRMTNVTATGTAGALENLTYALDAANNVSAITDAVHAGNSQTLAYDVINRLTTAASGTGGYGSLAWAYDKVGNLASQTAGSATTTYAYTAASNRLASITAGTVTTPVATNANGNITSVPPANSSEPATFAYNVANRLSSVTGSPTAASYVYDDWGRRFSKADTGGATTTFAYGIFGALLEETTGSAVTDYIYVNGRLLGTFVPAPSSATGGSGDSGETGINHLRSPTRHVGGAKLAASAWSRTRMGSGTGAVPIFVAGLLLAAVVWLRGRKRVASALTPLALGLALAACPPPTPAPSDAGGDAAGPKPDGGSDASASEAGADAESDASTKADGGAADSGLDATASTDGGNSDAGTDAATDAAVTTPDGGTEAGGDAGPTASIGGKLYYVHADHLGTPQLVTDGSQNVVWSATYQPYGATGTITASITQNLRLPGQYADSETGFNYNGFRDYMPNLGRYLETDPIGLRGGANGYAYVDANPIRDADLSGLGEEDVCLPDWGPHPWRDTWNIVVESFGEALWATVTIRVLGPRGAVIFKRFLFPEPPTTQSNPPTGTPIGEPAPVSEPPAGNEGECPSCTTHQDRLNQENKDGTSARGRGRSLLDR